MASPFTVKGVNHIEKMNIMTILKLIMRELHGPRQVDRSGLRQYLRLFTDNPFLGLDTHI